MSCTVFELINSVFCAVEDPTSPSCDDTVTGKHDNLSL